MKKLLIMLAFVSATVLYAQEPGIPFRVGDKFGVADAKGKMLVPAQYDIVEPELYNGVQYLIAYNLTANGPQSSLIYNNKIIVDSKPYKKYYIQHGLVKAVEFRQIAQSASHSEKNFKEIYHLYDLKGKDIFTADFKSIEIFDGVSNNEKLKDILIGTLDDGDKSSLYLYDTKAKKITRTFFESVKNLEVDMGWHTNDKNRDITLTYTDKDNKEKQMVLNVNNGTVKLVSDTAYKPSEKEDSWDDVSIGVDQMVGDINVEPFGTPVLVNAANETKILSVRKVSLKRGYYYLPKAIEEILITNQSLYANQQYIVSKDGKQGLFSVYKNDYAVPPVYDEIIFAELEGIGGGYIVRNGDKYGAQIYGHPENKFVAPVFDKIPLLVNADYFGKNKPLFKLFDENGKLFCYADETGKLFYKP